MASDVREDFRSLLESLCYASPAYNAIVQMLFLLPLKAKTLMRMYPELMEREEELIELFYLRYSGEGSLQAEYGPAPSLGHHLAGLYRSLFRILADAGRRSLLLRLAGVSEEEFRKIDPLRAWIEVSLEYLAKTDKDSLKLLEAVVEKLSEKKPDDSVSWEEVGKAARVQDFDSAMKTLEHFSLILPESSYSVYARNCPLLLDAYSDLRAKLRGLLR
jgi:hypothetical protein